jgi:hypothetical protein
MMRKMKNIGYIIFVGAMMALLMACRDNEPSEMRLGEALSVNVGVAEFNSGGFATRTADTGYTTTFTDGDRIGITVIKDGSTILDNNIPYRYDGSTWSPVNAANAVYRYPGDIAYLVYYPYDATMDDIKTVDEIIATFTLGADQRTHIAYASCDLMTGMGTFSATELSVILTHALSLVEVNLPAVSADVTLSVNGGEEYLPYNIAGTIYRCILKPAESATLSGTYTMGGFTFGWHQDDTALVVGEYIRVNAVNALHTGDVTVNYADGSSETVVYDPLTGNIPYTHSETTISSVELPGQEGKSFLIGRQTGSELKLKIDGGGDLQFRPANSDGYIPIGSYAEFQLIGTGPDALGGSYRQQAALDLMDREWTPIGISDDETIFNPFSGTYDGDGYTISNLHIDRPEGVYVGLFGCINDAELNNIHIVSGSVTGTESVGSVCGYIYSGNVAACSNAASVEGTDMAGGIVGGNSDGTISACRNSGAVFGSLGVGGVVGSNTAIVVACYNTGAISADTYIGGIAGMNGAANSITACYNTGLITGNDNVGGVAGANSGTVESCYWIVGTAVVGVNNIIDAEEETEGVDVDVVSFTIPPGFTPDAITYPQWSIGDGIGEGYWKNHTASGGAPQLWWEE